MLHNSSLKPYGEQRMQTKHLEPQNSSVSNKLANILTLFQLTLQFTEAILTTCFFHSSLYTNSLACFFFDLEHRVVATATAASSHIPMFVYIWVAWVSW